MIAGAPQLDFSKPPQQQLPLRGDAPDSLTLVRNPSWQAASDPLRAALPDRIELVPVKDPHTAQRLIERGAIDMALNSDTSPQPSSGSAGPASPRDSIGFLSLDVAMPPLNDLHVRRAINFAIARQPLAGIWNRRGRPAVPDTHIGLDDQENDLLLNFDPYHAATGDLKAARREMARSRYDLDHDGRCDGSVCRGILLWTHRDVPEMVATARRVLPDLKRIGLDVHLYIQSGKRFVSTYQDPRVHVQIRLNGWVKDTLSPSTYFAPLFGGTSLQVTGQINFDEAHLGSPPTQLKRWGYHITHVPSVDGRIRQCLSLTFGEQTRCYAELDHYLTTQVVPWVSLISLVTSRRTSSRVSRFNFDPFPSAPLPALDRVVLRAHTALAPLPRREHPVPPIPDGVYRFTLTRSDLLRFDPKFKPADFQNKTGTATVYLRHGRFESVKRAHRVMDDPITVGIYRGRGHHVTFHVQQPTSNALTVPRARWRFDGHALHFRLVGCGTLDRRTCKDVRANYEAHPWVKVADLP